MPRDQTPHPRTKRLFGLGFLGRALGIESPPWQECQGTQAPIMRELHPAESGSRLTEVTTGNQSSINSQPQRLERLRLLLPIHPWSGPGRGKPGRFATAMSWGTASIYPQIPENHGIMLVSMRRGESGGFSFIRRIQTLHLFAPWGVPRDRNKSEASTGPQTGDNTGSECSLPMKTRDAPASRWIRTIHGFC